MGLKKLLKKVGKAAAIGGAGYLALKGLGGKKSISSDIDNARGSGLRNKLRAAMPGNLSKSAGPYKDNTGPGAKTLGGSIGKKWSNFYDDSAGQGLKKGGRVTGVAKRGFGRALKSNKK